MTNLEGLRDNPLYQKGIQHVQRKEWAEASQCFERLRTEYPDLRGLDLPSIHARLRASVRNGDVRPRRQPLVPLKRVILLGGAVGLVAVLAFLLMRVQWGAKPAETGNRQALVSQLLSKGGFYLESESYGEAARTFEDVLSLAPNNEAARQGLAWAKGLAEQSAMYDEAIRYLKEKRYDKARPLIQAINESRSDYKDVKQLLALIQEKSRLDNLFDEASRAYNAYNWQEAAYLLEQVKAINPTYMAADVNAGLFAAYYNQALVVTSGNGEPRARYDIALGFLDKALAISPNDARARQQKVNILALKQSLPSEDAR